MESTLVKRNSRSALTRYALGVAAPVVALLVRLPLQSILADKVPYITFFLATSVAAHLGGLGPGLVATALGAAFASVYFVSLARPLHAWEVGDVLGLMLFLTVSSFISYLAGRLMETRQHEQALRLLFQQTLTSIGDGLISVDAAQRVRLMNPVAENLLGWTMAEAVNRPITEIFRIVREGTDHPVELPVERILRTGAVTGLDGQVELVRRNGERITIDDSGAPIWDEAGKVAGAVLVFRDITAKRHAEQKLAVSERRAGIILDSIGDAFLLLDREWRFVQVNSAAEELLRLPSSALERRSVWEVFPAALGSPVEFHLRRALIDNIHEEFEFHYPPWDRWFEIGAHPSSEGLAIYVRDITDRKRNAVALLRLNEDLRQFTWALTHDVRAPLRMITTSAQLLHRKIATTLDAGANEFMEHIVTGAQRISRLVDGLLDFTNAGALDTVEAVPVDTDMALQEALAALEMSIRESHAEIVREPLPAVLGNAVHISQVFQNLIANALKYREPGVKPVVRITARREGLHFVFAVADNGIGIAPEFHERIFTPFERLHGAEIAGSGIGLATCKRIVERNRGRIWVESRPGEGSTFYFSLPGV